MNTIVLVDDSSLQLRLYRQMLKLLPDTNSIPFASSTDALKWCEQNEPDLVLLDYNMPELDGLEFIKRFRTLSGKVTVPVVVITGDADRELRRSALEFGADDYLSKPVDAIELRTRVRNMLRIREHGRMLADKAAWLTEEVKRATASLVDRECETIYRLTRASEHSDNGTGEHIIRIGLFAASVAAALGLTHEEQELLRLATPMHDIGKVGTPDTILQKVGALTAEEWEVMKLHTVAGYDILRDSESPLLQKGAEIALSHHERYDGTGYPFGLADEQIPLSGRIAAICDVFDALLSKRPYKDAWPLPHVLEHIEQESGHHFDPRVVAAFKQVLPELLEIRERVNGTEAEDVEEGFDGNKVA
ncbi:MAG TPA: HD domain-containing phosphohydrolase [Candidatus Acidoferrales bacterium]|nr:HD domain-containing phosphohydrolase [Candidatus Acidoferrales bacterium]